MFVPVSKVLWEHGSARVFIYISHFKGGIECRHRDWLPPKAENIYYLALRRKSLPTSLESKGSAVHDCNWTAARLSSALRCPKRLFTHFILVDPCRWGTESNQWYNSDSHCTPHFPTSSKLLLPIPGVSQRAWCEN